ncbi:hypothetical protein PH505_aj00420 [Pseudoalteromonas distincta]|nr:hypothetical protein PH505_aj00420 [Pseudoalteromonas distincta]
MVISLYRYICMLIDLNAYKKFNNFYKKSPTKIKPLLAAFSVGL